MNDKKNREPMVIALATGKGGSMKTTSAVFLACALVDQSRGEQHVLVADADVQGDAKDWWYRAAELDDPLPFDVMSAAPADIAHLHGINDRLDDPVDWVLIDSAPYGRALDESVNDAEGWVKTSVSLRASTRRRLKTFAAEHDMRIQEVIDAALETYLGFGGER